MISTGTINPNRQQVLAEMLRVVRVLDYVNVRGLTQISDEGFISELIHQVIDENPGELARYLEGKETGRMFFGQVVRLAHGRANPKVIRAALDRQLLEYKKTS